MGWFVVVSAIYTVGRKSPILIYPSFWRHR